MSKIKFIIPRKSDERKTLFKQAKQAGLKIKGSCKKGTCGKCVVRVKGDVSKPTERELKTLGKDRIERGYRLACVAYNRGDVNITIPLRPHK